MSYIRVLVLYMCPHDRSLRRDQPPRESTESLYSLSGGVIVYSYYYCMSHIRVLVLILLHVYAAHPEQIKSTQYEDTFIFLINVSSY